MIFELSNAERKYLGLDEVKENWIRKEIVGGNMSKKLVSATILIMIGEVLSLARVYFTEAMSGIPGFVTAFLLIISIILEVVGIILLFICIANYDKKKK